MPFGHHQDDSSSDFVNLPAVLSQFSALSLGDRCAELLQPISAAIGAARGDSGIGRPTLTMDVLLLPWLPDKLWLKGNLEEIRAAVALESILEDAFQALVLARLLVRHERFDAPTGTTVYYGISPDGTAALGRGEVAAVVARRLPG
jgi:hypothetical protein